MVFEMVIEVQMLSDGEELSMRRDSCVVSKVLEKSQVVMKMRLVECVLEHPYCVVHQSYHWNILMAWRLEWCCQIAQPSVASSKFCLLARLFEVS